MNNLENNKLIITVMVVIALLILGAGGYYFYNQSQNSQTAKINPPTQQQAQEEVKKLVSEVGQLMELPIGETPTVATVTDITKLKDQPFFQKAKNGDKVLIYSQAKKAILYDPIGKKVIDVAPINAGTSSAQLASPVPNGTGASPSPKPSSSPKSTPAQ